MKSLLRPQINFIKMIHPPKTYQDLKVKALDNAFDEIQENKTKVQCLLSYLANEETRRGKFKRLQGHNDLFSMRITGNDRLIFKQETHNGTLEVSILSAKGHETFEKRLKKDLSFSDVDWNS